jgi:hypothetical protein
MVFFPMNVCIILKSKALHYWAGNVCRNEEREREREREKKSSKSFGSFATRVPSSSLLFLQHFFMNISR